MAIQLKQAKSFSGLNLRLFSTDTPVDETVFKTAEDGLRFLLEKQEYSGQNVSVVIANKETTQDELRNKIVSLLGNESHIQNSLEESSNVEAGAYSFFDEARNNHAILFRYHLLPEYSVAYFYPTILHELLHKEFHPTIYLDRIAISLSEKILDLKFSRPDILVPLTKALCSPLIRYGSSYVEIGVNKKLSRLIGVQRILPSLEAGSYRLAKTATQSPSEDLKLKPLLLALGDAIDFDLWSAYDLARKIRSIMLFAEYSVPTLAYGYRSPVITKHSTSTLGRLQKYMPDIENAYMQIPEYYDRTLAQSIFNQINGVVHRIYRDHGMEYPGRIKSV